jgi:hypothetical protein
MSELCTHLQFGCWSGDKENCAYSWVILSPRADCLNREQNYIIENHSGLVGRSVYSLRKLLLIVHIIKGTPDIHLVSTSL